MPLYDFRNKETGEIVEIKMSYKDYDDYLANNPHMERYHSVENFPAFGDHQPAEQKSESHVL